MREAITSGLPLATDDNLVAALVNIEDGKRPGRRAGDVAPIEIVGSVVAGAPDLAQVGAILHDAAEVGAGSGERAEGAVGIENQQARLVAKAKDLAGVGLHLGNFCGNHLVSTEIRHRWRDKVAQYRIEKRCQRGKDATAEEYFYGAAARGIGLGSMVSAHDPHPQPQQTYLRL